MCGYKNLKQEGYKRKIEWVKDRLKEGMKYKTLYSDSDGTLGQIEYIPGEYSWRPVDARGYMFIHCICIFPKEYKEQGYGTRLLKECLKDAEKNKMYGAAVVSRKGTWMAGNNLFVKNGFLVTDNAPPDFELLVKKFRNNSPDPKFKTGIAKRLNKHKKGLTIFTSDQCPYVFKSVNEISETAEKTYTIKPKIIELKSYKDAQNSPCPFGSFCVVYNGKVIADHPISNKRFTNIMNKIL